MDELEEMMKEMLANKGAKELTNAQVGRYLNLHDTSKIVAKEAEKTAFSRLQAGKKIPGRKLVTGRSNRSWGEGAEEAIVAKLGEEAMTVSVLKSPAQIDKLPFGTELTAAHAVKPPGGLKVAAEGDARAQINKDAKSLFTDQTEKK